MPCSKCAAVPKCPYLSLESRGAHELGDPAAAAPLQRDDDDEEEEDDDEEEEGGDEHSHFGGDGFPDAAYDQNALDYQLFC